MRPIHYQPLGPLLPGEGSRTLLALALEAGAAPCPVVLVGAPPEVMRDSMLSAQLQRETQRAVVFEHPHILRVHGLVTLEDRIARVTEYADGESLRRVLEVGQRLPPPFAALVAADVAMGIHYAHVAGNDDGTPLVHADLRPETVMVSFNGVCKVAGYGALGVAPREKDGRRVRNRRLYSAPEQLMGGREASSVLTDVFLLGLLLYECLSGRKPFQESLEPDKAILSRPLPPLPVEVPLAFNEVVRRATAKRAGERYPTALAFREAVVAVAGQLPTSEAFAQHLTTLFPLDSEARVARNRLIAKGLKEVVRSTPAPTPVIEAVRRPAPSPPPPMKAAAPAPARVTPPAQAVVPVPAAPVVPPTRPVRAPRSSALLAVGFGAVLLVSAVGTVWSLRKQPTPPVMPAEAPAVVEAVVEAPVPAPVPQPDALPPAPEPQASTDAGVGVASTAPSTAAEPPRVPATGSGEPRSLVELFVSPDVDVSLEGRALGRTPLTIPLPAGRHKLMLSDAEKGLRTNRIIDVRPNDTMTFRVRLGMGSVLVVAPNGARIQLDGRELGTAPLAEVTMFEGQHRLLVTLDDAVWEQPFFLMGEQRLVFTPEFEEP